MERTKIAITLGLIFIFFSFKLNLVPIHLNQDELEFALDAKLLSETGRDSLGNFLPFYFWHLGSFWATPAITYLGAIFLRFLPISEMAIRMPSSLVGVGIIFFLYLIAKNYFKKRRLLVITIFLCLTTPVLFIHSRLLLDNLYIVLFVCFWLLSLFIFEREKKLVYMFLAGLALGVGIHSYHAAKIYMPLYYMATLLYGYIVNRKSFLKFFLTTTIGFLIPVVSFIPWFLKYPDTWLNQVSYLASLDKTVKMGHGIWGVFNISRISFFVNNYFTYFNPRILFIEGDRSLIHSTGLVGAFTFPIVFLLVFGILQVFKERNLISKIILFGFLTYPMAPAIVNDPQRISRGLVVIPFVILLSTMGVRFLLTQKDDIFKGLLYLVLVWNLILFALFLNDYFGEYRTGSYGWFNNDIGGGVESVIKNTKLRTVNKIYLDQYIPFVDRYFRFYQLKYGVSLNNWEFYDYKNQNFEEYGAGSILLVRYDHMPLGHGDDIWGFHKIETIREPDGKETFFVYYKSK